MGGPRVRAHGAPARLPAVERVGGVGSVEEWVVWDVRGVVEPGYARGVRADRALQPREIRDQPELVHVLELRDWRAAVRGRVLRDHTLNAGLAAIRRVPIRVGVARLAGRATRVASARIAAASVDARLGRAGRWRRTHAAAGPAMRCAVEGRFAAVWHVAIGVDPTGEASDLTIARDAGARCVRKIGTRVAACATMGGAVESSLATVCGVPVAVAPARGAREGTIARDASGRRIRRIGTYVATGAAVRGAGEIPQATGGAPVAVSPARSEERSARRGCARGRRMLRRRADVAA